MPDRSEATRVENARIAMAGRMHHFGDHSPVPFLCECTDDACREFVSIPLNRYDAVREDGLYLVAPGHLFAGVLIANDRGFDAYLRDGLAAAQE